MTIAEKNIVETYAKLFEGLNATSKLAWLEKLAKSLKTARKRRDKAFFSAFGADKPAEEMAREVRESRRLGSRH